MSVADAIELACLMEATAQKPGNVHPAAAFEDLCYRDFVLAAHAIADPLSHIDAPGLGAAILNSVVAARTATGTNVNLGIVLLIAPLAAVPADRPLATGVEPILRQTSVRDAELVYEAIRLAAPGGLGQSASQDIGQRPTVTLREAMALAADRDRIAEQYVTNFRLVFAARDKFVEFMRRSEDWTSAIVQLQLWMMSIWPDTLIARKCGIGVASESAHRAAAVLAAAEHAPFAYSRQLLEFDHWLRADGHRRNPGTTADLIAATLFAALRDGLINAPHRDEIQQFADEAHQQFNPTSENST